MSDYEKALLEVAAKVQEARLLHQQVVFNDGPPLSETAKAALKLTTETLTALMKCRDCQR